MENDLFGGVGIVVDIIKGENFLKIAETLTRMGIAAKNENKLYQSCHILHKRDELGVSHYAIVHFKEMFILDGKEATLSQSDKDRLLLVVSLLEKWNLIKVIDEEIQYNFEIIPDLKIIPYKEKQYWTLEAKYKIGKKKTHE